jgi:hypothetical protein
VSFPSPAGLPSGIIDDDAVFDAAVPCNAERAAAVTTCGVGDEGTYERGTASFWRRANAERGVQVGLLRCIVGDPFRPLSFRPTWAAPPVQLLARTLRHRHGEAGPGRRTLSGR